MQGAAKALAFDSIRNRMVYVCWNQAGGLGDYSLETSEFDGATWLRRGPADPLLAYYSSIAYDTDHRAILVYGPRLNRNDTSDQLWSWDGNSWTLLSDSGPPTREGHGMAYDAARHRLVVFGGNAGYVSRGDTWEWDGQTWSQRAANGPSPRSLVNMVYDAAIGHVVLFGGYDYSGPDPVYWGDTWEWDGVSWTQRATSGPAARAHQGMAYDSDRGRVVMYGGLASNTTTWHDTWEWDGTIWTQGAILEEPVIPYGSMAYDPVRHRSVLIGYGSGREGMAEWDGNAWTFRAQSVPFFRSIMGLTAYDTQRSRMVVFGGAEDYFTHNDTWELSSDSGPPLITANPADQSTHLGESVSLSVSATGIDPLTYQWYHGPPRVVIDGPGGASTGGGTVTGSGTATMTIIGVTAADAGGPTSAYHCVVTDSCGSMITRDARLTVLPPCGSPDFDGDGSAGTDADIEAFFACIAGTCCSTCGTADFDRDGSVATDADIEAFFRVLSGGPC
jgi:hypothetical protein